MHTSWADGFTVLPPSIAASTTTTTTTTPPDDDFDPTTVTPGWQGFLAIGFVAAATILLIIDMTRRVRRVRYREEVKRDLDAEQSNAQSGDR